MNTQRLRALTIATLFLLLVSTFGAGCIGTISPLPNEVMIRENIIAVDAEYVPSALIVSLLTNPNNYEPGLFTAIDEYLPADKPVIEVGAGIGAVSAYVNDRITITTDHIAVEPNPYYTGLLKITKEKNGLGTRFIEGAISYEKTFVPYVVARHVVDENSVRAYDEETIDVQALTVSQVISGSAFVDKQNITLIVDAEGVAEEIFDNEPMLSAAVSTIIATVNSAGEQETLIRKAAGSGYSLVNVPNADTSGLITLVFTRG